MHSRIELSHPILPWRYAIKGAKSISTVFFMRKKNWFVPRLFGRPSSKSIFARTSPPGTKVVDLKYPVQHRGI